MSRKTRWIFNYLQQNMGNRVGDDRSYRVKTTGVVGSGARYYGICVDRRGRDSGETKSPEGRKDKKKER